MIIHLKDLCVRGDFAILVLIWSGLLPCCIFSVHKGLGVLVYALAGFCGLRVILFAALSRFCPIAAMAGWACVLATPK